MSAVGHLALLAVAIAALAGASLRIAATRFEELAGRLLGAVTVGVAFAIVESLLLGLTGEGASPWLLTATAVATWVVTRPRFAAPAPSVRSQVVAGWIGLGWWTRAAAGALTAVAVGQAILENQHPRLGFDGETYHVSQISVWIGTGHPGAMHQTITGLATQAYPKSFELIAFWCAAISRTMAILNPLEILFDALVVIAFAHCLRRAGCDAMVTALAVAAALFFPWNGQEVGYVYNDIPALGFLAMTVALCLASARRPAGFGLALLAAGETIGMKTTTALIAAVAVVWTAVRIRGELRAVARRTTPYAAVAVAIGGVWPAIDIGRYHAPLWPFSRWPDGPPQPRVFLVYGRTFLSNPSRTLHAVGWHYGLLDVGGLLVLLAGAVVVAVLSAITPGGQPSRRVVIGITMVVVVQTGLWTVQPFSGVAPGMILYTLSVLRYLGVSATAAAAVLAIAAMRNRLVWLASVLLLGFALVVDLIYDDRDNLRLFPHPYGWLALAAAGAMLGSIRPLGRLVGVRGAAFATLVACCLLTAIQATSYLQNDIRTSGDSLLTDAPILAYLESQPGWAHGHAPVAAGFSDFATLGGADFSHPLSFVSPREPCPALRAEAESGWLIMWRQAAPNSLARAFTFRSKCLTGIAPATTLADVVRIYAPAGLRVQ